MKKIIFSLLLIPMALVSSDAQKYFTRDGMITFLSDAPVEKIEASNSKAMSVLDIESGKLEFAVLIKAFQFEKALMQEHFNENYMESDKFPKAKFKGQIENPESVDFFRDGTYPVTVTGKLTIHGVTNDVELESQFRIKDGQISADSSFEILVADYDIKIPGVVRDNIAKVVQIEVSADYQEFKKGS